MLKRLRYALYVLVAVTMLVLLALSISEGVGLVHGFNSGRLMFHPLYVLPVYIIGFAIAPFLAEHLPISSDIHNRRPSSKPPVGYMVRCLLLVASGLVLAVSLSVVLFLIERFT